MKYFVDNFERRGTCYHEFACGKWDGKTFWDDNSLFLRDDYMSDLKLYELIFKPAFEADGTKFNRWGANEVTRELWNRMISLAEDVGGEVQDLFFEITTWAEKNFSHNDVFSIIGM